MTSGREIDESKRIPTKKQVVAGFVVYRKTSDGIKFLLLYRRGNYWNFPKGHFMPGERSIDAALRELEEETGIKKSEMRMVPNFRAYERFYFKVGNQGIYDTVILFLAETHKAEITIRPREHSGYGWFLYNDAVNVIGKKYGDTRKVLKQATDFLRPRKKVVKPATAATATAGTPPAHASHTTHTAKPAAQAEKIEKKTPA
jgi:bis(5'-nucleosidyl)-tetraphosphatase